VEFGASIGQPMQSHLVVAVVLNFGDLCSTISCVESLLASDWKTVAVVVSDNSSDMLLKDRVAGMGPRVVYVDNHGNLGYSGGNNSGIEVALSMGAECVFVVNNDVCVVKDCVRTLVRAYSSLGESLGALYPQVRTESPSSHCSLGGRITIDGRSVHMLLPSRNVASVGGMHSEIDWIPGAAIFFSRKALLDVGLFESDFFCFCEDVDWSLRARARGFKLFNCPDAVVVHIGGNTTSKMPAEFREYYPLRNRLIVAFRHYRLIIALIVLLRALMYDLLLLSLKELLGNGNSLYLVRMQAIKDALLRQMKWKFLPH